MEALEFEFGERKIVAQLRRTAKRLLRIQVKPCGTVVVTAPTGEATEAVLERVQRKAAWIVRQLDKIAARPAATPERRFVSGETHLLLGRQYRLAMERADVESVQLDGARLKVELPDPANYQTCKRLVFEFYTKSARRVFKERLEAMAPPFLRRGVSMPRLIIRSMAKRWGSYTSSGRVILNVDLVRAAPTLIDYVICHELAHGLHPDHGKEWRDLMAAIMPDWENRKERLEAFLS